MGWGGGGGGEGLWGPSPPFSPRRGSQDGGGCDCSLGLERKLWRGLGWETRRKGLACSWGVEMNFPLMEGEERAEGGGFLGKLGDESPRDRALEGGEDMEPDQAGGLWAGRAAAMGSC